MSLLVSLLTQGGRNLEEDNLEGMLFSRIVNILCWVQAHVLFTSEFASSTGYLSKNVFLGKLFHCCFHFSSVCAIPEDFFGDRAVKGK